MSSNGSVTHWLDDIRRGNSAAAEALWQRYFPELVRLAREKLGDVPRGAADEEDVALSAMDSFFDAAQQGRFPDLADRHDLWRLLLQMTARKVVDLKRRETRQRRGGGRVRHESAISETRLESDSGALARIVGDTPTPEFAAMMAEECRRLIEMLDANLQALALAKLQGYENREIAAQSDCSVRTVERRLHLIRRKWKKDQVP
jgi:DNA-directed RNA polymerase specialized sigma24 family protein